MTTWILLSLLLFFLGCLRRPQLPRPTVPRVRQASPSPAPTVPSRPTPAPVRTSASPASPGAATTSPRLADVAFAYECAVLELTELSEATKTRALGGLTGTILPLVGGVPLDELTPQLQRGVGRVLASEAESGEEWIVLVWNDFMRWSRIHFGSQTIPRRL